jgi:hypothetical protein
MQSEWQIPELADVARLAWRLDGAAVLGGLDWHRARMAAEGRGAPHAHDRRARVLGLHAGDRRERRRGRRPVARDSGHRRLAGIKTIAAVVELVRGSDLPLDGLADHFDNTLVARDHRGKVIGCVALELYGESALPGRLPLLNRSEGRV